MSEKNAVSGEESLAGHPYGGRCPNCGAVWVVGQKYCIWCGLRYDAAAFERLAVLDAERHAIMASLLPQAAMTVPLVQVSSAFAGVGQEAALVPKASATVAGTVSDTERPSPSPRKSLSWLLPAMVYGGGVLMVVGTLVYLRSMIVEYPMVQLGLITAAMVVFLVVGVRGLRHQPGNLLSQGWLWLGMLLLPLDLWLGIRYGWLPSGIGWGYAMGCAAVYSLLAAWLSDRAVPHLALCTGLVGVLWLEDAVLPSAAATFGLLSVVAMGLAIWSVRFPTQVMAPASWWWGNVAVGLCALATPSLDEPWLGSITGLTCLVLGALTTRQRAAWVHLAWVWGGGGLGLLTMAYGRWIEQHDLPLSWMAAGWAGWLWVLTLGESAATRWASRLKENTGFAGCFAVLCQWSERILAGLLGLWALFGVVISFELWLLANPGNSVRMTIQEALGHGLAWTLVAGWSWWQMRKTLMWFPLCLAVVSILALSSSLVQSTLERQIISPALPLLALPLMFCAIRFGIEWLGVLLGQKYSTEVDTNFGLDFGLPHHPAITPSRWLVDCCAVVYLLGLLVRTTVDWQPVYTVGIAMIALYGGLGWFLSSTPGLQRGYALALWGIAYLGLLATGSGIGRLGWLDVLPWMSLVAGLVVVVVSRPVVDESCLRASLRDISLFMLGWSVLGSLVGSVVSTRLEASHSLSLASAAGTGWVAAVRRQLPLLGLFATICGGLSAVHAARLSGCPVEGLPMVGVLYGYSAAWLGWRLLRQAKKHTKEEAEVFLWGKLAIGGQFCLWVGAAGALVVLEGHFPILIGCSLVCAASALAVASFLTKDATHDLYASGALAWWGVTYMWWLHSLALPSFAQVAYLTLPYGLVLAGVGWLKWRWQRGHPALARLFIWLGSFVFCFPVTFEAMLHRLSSEGTLSENILASTTALTALVVGLSTGWKGPTVAGALALGAHMLVVLAVSVPWSDVPYGVYLALVGLGLFVAGTQLWRRYRSG
ncbi:MAG: hypothetical protein ACUVR8_08080 [Acidobacteriota bacterium]